MVCLVICFGCTNRISDSKWFKNSMIVHKKNSGGGAAQVGWLGSSVRSELWGSFPMIRGPVLYSAILKDRAPQTVMSSMRGSW